MTESSNNRWLHRFAVLTAVATLTLIGVGGLVTSHEAGMSVPDWPNSYGYNMFLFPPSKWVGGILYEHTHRLWASGVGFLTIILMLWLWVKEPRIWMRWLGVATLLVVLLQGVLGGLRVVLSKDEIGIFHAALAQLFFVLTCAIALFTSKWWTQSEKFPRAIGAGKWPVLFLATTFLILCQLILGATMRHQHAGLAIPDFPLAYGKLWPATDVASVAHYNEQRVEITDYNPITAFQVQLQMVHRIVALLILGAVGFCAWKVRRDQGVIRWFCFAWLGLILLQAGLGAATVLSGKAADIATAHVLVGALSLAAGTLIAIMLFRFPQRAGAGSFANAVLQQPSAIDLARAIEAGSAGKLPATR